VRKGEYVAMNNLHKASLWETMNNELGTMNGELCKMKNSEKQCANVLMCSEDYRLEIRRTAESQNYRTAEPQNFETAKLHGLIATNN
jgi:hypothetical protein